jgi:S-adenosylmethionine:tRNA ribosyltransferase-isomerase
VDVSLFDFDLPPEAIAQRPAPRGTARLLTLDRRTGVVAHRSVADLPEILRPGDLLVVNDTRVIPARIFGTDERGRRTEFLLAERMTAGSSEADDEGERWRCLAKPGRRVKAGRTFFFERGWTAEAVPATSTPPGTGASTLPPSKKSAEAIRAETGVHVLRFAKHGSRDSLLSDLPAFGSAPLPPYIHRPGGEADARDAVDYQTVYAAAPGAIAAPTAGLHFTPELMELLGRRGVEIAPVTLHVGLGTFRPVKVEHVEEHAMEPERGAIPEATAAAIATAKAAGRRVVAVGTTTVRALEGVAAVRGTAAAGPFETNLFLFPGASFRVVDALLTNFHLPRSTLLMLVAAFAGREKVLAAYHEAIRAGYRFFSYGDTMYVE